MTRFNFTLRKNRNQLTKYLVHKCKFFKKFKSFYPWQHKSILYYVLSGTVDPDSLRSPDSRPEAIQFILALFLGGSALGSDPERLELIGGFNNQ